MERSGGTGPTGSSVGSATGDMGQCMGVTSGYDDTGVLLSTFRSREGYAHGEHKIYEISGKLIVIHHYLYGDFVSQQEYRHHELVERLAGVQT